MPSRLFVTDAPVPIYEFDPIETISTTEPSVIYIRARMDVETAGKVTSELFAMDREKGGMEVYAGANQTALLVHNIIRWDGPLFYQTNASDEIIRDQQGRPLLIACTPENIRKLDPNDPFIANVLEEIATRNKKRASPKAGSTTPDTFMTDGVADSMVSPVSSESPSANGTLRSSLLRSLDGRRERSENSILTS